MKLTEMISTVWKLQPEWTFIQNTTPILPKILISHWSQVFSEFFLRKGNVPCSINKGQPRTFPKCQAQPGHAHFFRRGKTAGIFCSIPESTTCTPCCPHRVGLGQKVTRSPFVDSAKVLPSKAPSPAAAPACLCHWQPKTALSKKVESTENY